MPDGGSRPAGAGGGVDRRAGADRSNLRLGLFMGALVIALIAGFGLGRLNPLDKSPTDSTVRADHTYPPGTGAHEHGTTAGTGAEVGGLSVSDSKFTLVPVETTLPAGGEHDFRFRVLDAARQPVTGYAVVHDKPMHLVVARRDLTGYQHLHPSMAADGTWSVPLTLPEPGVYRAYADFTVTADGTGGTGGDTGGTAVTLGVDLVVTGDYQPRPLPAVARENTVDGFTVTYQGTAQVGATAPLLFRVFSSGSPVTDLEPYLGAYGHLVALREGDLGYVHVHPEEALGPDGGIKFWLAAPSPGSYRMFLDFQFAGVVRTAEFTLTVG